MQILKYSSTQFLFIFVTSEGYNMGKQLIIIKITFSFVGNLTYCLVLMLEKISAKQAKTLRLLIN